MNKENIQVNSLQPLAVRPKEAAKLIGVSLRTFYSMKSCGLLPPAIKVGGCVFYKLEDIQEWVRLGCPSLSEFVKIKEPNI